MKNTIKAFLPLIAVLALLSACTLSCQQGSSSTKNFKFTLSDSAVKTIEKRDSITESKSQRDSLSVTGNETLQQDSCVLSCLRQGQCTTPECIPCIIRAHEITDSIFKLHTLIPEPSIPMTQSEMTDKLQSGDCNDELYIKKFRRSFGFARLPYSNPWPHRTQRGYMIALFRALERLIPTPSEYTFYHVNGINSEDPTDIIFTIDVAGKTRYFDLSIPPDEIAE